MPSLLIVIKASLLLAAALAGTRVLRAAPAAGRHALWSVTFAALLALPWVGAVLPALDVPVPVAWARPARQMPGPAPEMPDLKVRPTDSSLRSGVTLRPSHAALQPSDLDHRSSVIGYRPSTHAYRPSDVGTLVRLVWL